MNIILRLKKGIINYHSSSFKNESKFIFNMIQSSSFSRTNRKFDSTKSGEANRSQRGIFQGKMDRWGFMKSHSMRQ